MAYKFDATTFDASIQPGFTVVSIGFDLVDDSIIDPDTGKPTVLASTNISMNIPASSTTAAAKTTIATACVSFLQEWYALWITKKERTVDWLSSNEAVLEAYINSHITF